MRATPGAVSLLPVVLVMLCSVYAAGEPDVVRPNEPFAKRSSAFETRLTADLTGYSGLWTLRAAAVSGHWTGLVSVFADGQGVHTVEGTDYVFTLSGGMSHSCKILSSDSFTVSLMQRSGLGPLGPLAWMLGPGVFIILVAVSRFTTPKFQITRTFVRFHYRGRLGVACIVFVLFIGLALAAKSTEQYGIQLIMYLLAACLVVLVGRHTVELDANSKALTLRTYYFAVLPVGTHKEFQLADIENFYVETNRRGTRYRLMMRLNNGTTKRISGFNVGTGELSLKIVLILNRFIRRHTPEVHRPPAPPLPAPTMHHRRPVQAAPPAGYPAALGGAASNAAVAATPLAIAIELTDQPTDGSELAYGTPVTPDDHDHELPPSDPEAGPSSELPPADNDTNPLLNSGTMSWRSDS